MKILKQKKINFDVDCFNKAGVNSSSNLVEIRAVFLKISDIDTIKETFYAEVFIEAVWLLAEDEGGGVKGYNPDTDWNPNIYIANCLGELKEKIWYDHCPVKSYQKELNQFKKYETGNKLSVALGNFIRDDLSI